MRSVEFVELDIVFGDGDLQVDLGGHRALLRHYGPAHAADDQVVLVDDRVLLTGDLVLTGQFPIVPYFPAFEADVDANHWIDVLDELPSLQPAIVVPGHGDLSDIRAIAEVRDFLTYVRDMASQLRANGASADDAGASIEAAARARWPSWGASLHGSSGLAGRALGVRFAEQLRVLHEHALAPDNRPPLLAAYLDRIIDPIVAFNREHPALMRLFGGTDVSADLQDLLADLRSRLLERFDTGFAARLPDFDPDQRRRMVIVSLQIALALLPLTLGPDGSQGDAFAMELKAALRAYWAVAFHDSA